MTEATGPRDIGPNSTLEEVSGIPADGAEDTSVDADRRAGYESGGDEAVVIPADGAAATGDQADDSHGADIAAGFDDDISRDSGTEGMADGS